MNVHEITDLTVQLLTSSAFVTLILGIVAAVLFGPPLRCRLRRLTKLTILGDLFSLELDGRISGAERETAEVVTRENQEAVEKLIQQAAVVGYTMRADGLTKPPVLEITWKDDKPQVMISAQTMRDVVEAVERQRRQPAAIERRQPVSEAAGWWARKLASLARDGRGVH